MTKLNELIQQLCPDGVEYCKLKDFLMIKNGSDYKHFESGTFPVYGSGGIMAYIDHYAYNRPSVLIPRKGSIDKLYYVEEPFWNVDTIFYTDINTEKAIPKYVYHCLQSEHLEQYNTAGGVPSLTQKVLNKIKILLPPIEVQREIVRILDDFTEQTEQLKASLTAELTARKKQYEYYRDKLLMFGDDVPYRQIKDICDIVDYRGKTPTKTSSGVFLVTAKNIRKGFIDYGKSQEYISASDYDDVMRRGIPKIGDVLITTEAPCGNVAQVDREGIALAQRVIKYRPKSEIINSEYLKYVLLGKEFQSKLNAAATGGTVKGIKGSKLHKLTIPVPSIDVQEKVVSLLESFDVPCNDLTSGLPAEIAARQKQYEYYRDKLLTFKEAKA